MQKDAQLIKDNSMKSTVTIRIEGTLVTLICDGRISEKRFDDIAAAKACYDQFKSQIEAAEKVA